MPAISMILVPGQWSRHGGPPRRREAARCGPPSCSRATRVADRRRRRSPATAARAGRGPCRRAAAGWRRGSPRRSRCRRVGRDQGVVAAVDDERRHVHGGAAPPCGRRWRRWRRADGPRPPGRTPGRTRPPPWPGQRRVEPPLGRPGPRCARRSRCGVARSVGGGVSSTASASGVGLPSSRVAGRAHDRRQAAAAVGVLDGDRLGDHPAHRRAEDVGPLDAEVVEQADGVGGHVRQRVRHGRQLAAAEAGRHHGHRIGLLAVEVRGQPDVAVVVADHVATPRREAPRRTRRPRRSSGRRGP